MAAAEHETVQAECEVQTLAPLMADLLSSLANEPKPYRDVLDAWRTSCPRLDVWEEVTRRAFVERRFAVGQGALVVLSDAGRNFLDAFLAQRAKDDAGSASAPFAFAPMQAGCPQNLRNRGA